MINKIKNKIVSVWKWVKAKFIWLFLGGVCLAVGVQALPSQTPIVNSYFDFNGKTINCEYTDDNTNEDLIIRTDKSHYGGWNKTDVYFSIENISEQMENVDIQFYFGGKEILSDISELKKDVSYQVSVNDYGIKDFECIENWIATTTLEMRKEYTQYLCEKETRYCDSVKDKICTVNNAFIGAHEEIRYKDIWKGLVLAEVLSKDNLIPSKFISINKTVYEISAGEIKFFKAKIKFEPKSSGEFWIGASSDAISGRLDPWYNSSWDYKRAIILDHNQIATTTSAFPVLATSTETYLKTTTHSGKIENEYGFDIIFVDDDDSTLLNYEREKYASTTGEIAYWIKTDISSTTDKTIYMYYGNSGASDMATTTGVWDDNYMMVQHLQETPDNTADQIKDSTKNSNDGQTATMNSADQVAGQIDGSLDFDGGDDLVNVPDSSTLDVSSALTVSAWVKRDGTASFDGIAGHTSGASTDGWWLTIFTATYGNELNLMINNADHRSSGATVGAGVWTHVLTTWDGSNVRHYINGNLGETIVESGAHTSGNGSLVVANEDSGRSAWFDGTMDEFRVSNVVRTAGWIETEYNNQVSVGSFMTFGAEETESEVEAKPQSVIWFD